MPPAALAELAPEAEFELLLDFDEDEHAASDTAARTLTATALAFSVVCRFTANLSFEGADT